MHILSVHRNYQIELLRASLSRFFGDFDGAFFERALPVLVWLEFAEAEMVFEQGTMGDDVYFVVSGRLRATTIEPDKSERLVSEIPRGEAVGEMSLLTGEPRSATVTAVRASVLARLSRDGFDILVAEFPHIALSFARMVVGRLQRSNRARYATGRGADDLMSSNIAIVPISQSIDLVALASDVAAQLGLFGNTLVLTGRDVRNREGGRHLDGAGCEDGLPLTLWLDELESRHRFVLLVADTNDPQWMKHCLQRADEVLLVANAKDSTELRPLERDYFSRERPASRALRRLVLLHGPGVARPSGTAAWLEDRAPASHVHVRDGVRADIARLSRVIARRSIGLVLSGGGARGYAHLGVYRALHECGIDVDYVGGTSMGAAVASLIALGISPEEALERFRRFSNGRLLSDYRLFPMLSLLSGRRLDDFLTQALAGEDGSDPDMADTWKNFYCVATSYSHARQVVLRSGQLSKMVRASLSIPLYLPPVFRDREALIDGAVFNNFPTDIMALNGTGWMIGVDLRLEPFGPVGSDDVPSSWQMLRAAIWPFAKPSRPAFPSLAGMLLNVPMLASAARQAEAGKLADMVIRPELSSIGLLDWKALDRVVELGFRAASAECERMADERPEVWRSLLGRA